ncbi:MAG: UDP-3-O-(3-hydroxymyristoyl)glucosamine N-acyltransferase [Calditrichia bacterium]
MNKYGLEFTVGQIASFVGGTVEGDPDRKISGINKIEDAGSHELTFLANPKYKSLIYSTNAGAVLVKEDEMFTQGISASLIRVKDPYFTFVKLLERFIPVERNLETGISEMSFIHPEAQLGEDVSIAPFVYVGKNVVVGNGTQLFPGVVLLNNVKIGEYSILYPGVTVRENCEIGNRVIIHNGAVIGSDGFGFAPQDGKYEKIPQLGKVIIEDDVEIGANCTLDRATLGETRVKKGTKLDNLVHLAHNVEIGEHTVIAAQTGVSGSTKVGNHVMMGGQVGIVGHIKIEDGAQIAAQSGVSKLIKKGEIVLGSPARPIQKAKKIEAVLNNLPEFYQDIKKLRKKLTDDKIQSLETRLNELEQKLNTIIEKLG